MKHIKRLIALSIIVFLFTSCVVVTDNTRRFTVTYKATKEFASDNATLQYTDANGSIVTGTFNNNSFERIITVNDGESLELRASSIFGRITLSMTVERISNKELLTDQLKTCTNADANCLIAYTTP